jgi:prophage regulatory protein
MRVLNKKEVRAKTGGLGDVTIWRLEKSGRFPKRINITERRVGWVESEIDAWLDKRPRGICGQGESS